MVTGVEITSAQGQLITSSTKARCSHPWEPPEGFKNGSPKNNGGMLAINIANITMAGV